MERAEREDVREAMRSALERVDALYADALLDYRRAVHVSKNSVEERVLSPEAAGVCLRAFNGGEWRYASSSDLGRKSILGLAKKLRPEKGRLKIKTVEPWECDEEVKARKMEVGEVLERVRELFAAAEIEGIVDVKTRMSSHFMERVLLTSEGSELRQAIPRVSFVCKPIAKGRGRIDYDYLVEGGVGGSERLDGVTVESVRECAESSVGLLEAVKPLSGRVTAVLDGDVAGVLAHETFGHGTEADQVMRERSFLAPLLGERLAGEEVGVVDSSVADGGWANLFFDDDGVKASETVLMEGGVFKSLLHDRVTAAELGAELTANSRTESFKTKRFVRMTNTFFTPGSWELEEMVGEVKEGMILEKNMFGMEDPLGGGLQCTSKKGWIVRDGERRERVSRVAISGNIVDLFGSIDAVENERGFRINIGSCGKGTEDFVHAGTGGVHLRVRELTVSQG